MTEANEKASYNQAIAKSAWVRQGWIARSLASLYMPLILSQNAFLSSWPVPIQKLCFRETLGDCSFIFFIGSGSIVLLFVLLSASPPTMQDVVNDQVAALPAPGCL